jgi:hypothetical protein
MATSVEYGGGVGTDREVSDVFAVFHAIINPTPTSRPKIASYEVWVV